MPQMQIEDRYAQLIDKRGFKKYKDVYLTNGFGISYQYKLEPKVKEELMQKANCTIVRRVNFDSQLLSSSRDLNTTNYLKSKVEKYRFNDLKIDFMSLHVSEATLKKSPVVRIEVALRDNYGVVYDTIYKTISENSYKFIQTYESMLYPLDVTDSRLTGEGFFVRIPTKSLDTLKKIYLIFMV